MTEIRNMGQFYNQLKEEVALAADNNESGWTNEDFLTSAMLDYLEDAAEVNDPVICPFRDRGLQLNAYSFSEDYSSLDLFVTIYCDNDTPQTLGRNEVEAAIRREVALYRRAVNDLFKLFERDNETYEFAKTVHDHEEQIKQVNVCCLTNYLVKPVQINPAEIEGAHFSFSLWDLERLYKCVFSGKMREVIEIDFENEFGSLIPCIGNSTSDKYSAYLAIMSGEVLAKLYGKYRDRLLEKNVRSFLQVKSKVNKGIRDTLRNEPDMFLAYNNGISVTAENVNVIHSDHGDFIKSIRDMQIVNGGQTTASIYTASQDKKYPVDLSKVWVQMKLSVIESAQDMNEIVPKISACANTQNNVQIADFSANDPFHRRVEQLSRSIWAPAQNGGKPVNWFYERARGQYADELSQQGTTKKRKEFKEQHPYFTKTELAKYENTWDQLPYEVSEGSQKNFNKFTVRLAQNKGFIPDEKYFHNLVAKAIMFKRTEKLVSEQKFGGYRANIVTYTLAYISYKTGQRIDLDKIWREQRISPAFENEIIQICPLVRDIILNAPGGANAGEWCKKEACWNTIKEIKHDFAPEFINELVPVDHDSHDVRTEEPKVNSINSITDDEQIIIDKCSAIPASTWFALSKWAKITDTFEPWVRRLLFSVGMRISRKEEPSIKQAQYAMKAYDEALDKGFSK